MSDTTTGRASSICRSIQKLELLIQNRVENNALNGKFHSDGKLDQMQKELSLMMTQLSQLMPMLNDNERNNIVHNCEEFDEYLDEREQRAILLSKEVQKLERNIKTRLESDNILLFQNRDANAMNKDIELQAIQKELDQLVVQLSGMLPNLTEAAKEVVLSVPHFSSEHEPVCMSKLQCLVI